MVVDRDFLEKKDSVVIYWPVCFNELDKECVCTRYFDLIESFLFPLQYGLTVRDIEDYLQISDEMDFITFLRFKSFVTTKDDIQEYFKSLFPGQEVISCYQLEFFNVENLSLENLRELIEKTWDNIDEFSFDALSPNAFVKKGIFDCRSHTFHVDKETQD